MTMRGRFVRILDRTNRAKDSEAKNRPSILFGVAVSLLIHAIGLWLVLQQTPLIMKPSQSTDNGSITVSLTPASEIPPREVQTTDAHSPSPSTKPSSNHSQVRAKKHPQASIAKDVSTPPLEDIAPRKLPPAEDMFTQIEAARKRRAETQAGMAEREQSENAESENDNSIARANVAASLRGVGRQNQSDSGGLFQVRHLGYRYAEIFFRGWSIGSKRERTRLIEVEQGAEADIQIAIVKKMIEIIREEKTGDFIWESHRLGRDITLSARPQDSDELQQFLLKEFFPARL
jgi:hypothetical protein